MYVRPCAARRSEIKHLRYAAIGAGGSKMEYNPACHQSAILCNVDYTLCTGGLRPDFPLISIHGAAAMPREYI